MDVMTVALGIDIGGTGIKGALVDTDSGELASERIKLATPEGGEPQAVLETVLEIIDGLGSAADGVPVGVCFPAVVRHGTTMSAANVSKKWIGLEAERFFEKALGRDIVFVNDADAAGVAEARFGAAKGAASNPLYTAWGAMGLAAAASATRLAVSTSMVEQSISNVPGAAAVKT